EATPPDVGEGDLLQRARRPVPPEADELIGSYLGAAQLMGRRIAEMHAALTGDGLDPALAPEPLTSHHQRSVYQSQRNLTGRSMRLLRRALPSLGEAERAGAEEVLAREGELLRRFAALI